MGGPGIESESFDFSQTVSGAHPASCTDGTGSLFREVKRPGRGADHQPAEVNGRVKIYLYSPLDLHGLLKGELYLYFYLI